MARRPTCFPKLEDGPEFFKVFMPTFSSKDMLIPPAFVRKYIKTIPKVALLKAKSGRCWHVGVEKIEPNKLYFTTGWESFVSDHKLERGDFLLFNYTDKSSFEVKVYAKNSCKKELAVNNIIHKAPKAKTESGSSSEFNEDHKPCGGELIKIRDEDQYVPPKNPRFKVILTSTKSSIYTVQIPREVLIGIKLEGEIVLSCGNKKWTVGTKPRSDGCAIISSKWLEFRKGNNLKENDICLFELVLGRGNTCKEMKVCVIAGGAGASI